MSDVLLVPEALLARTPAGNAELNRPSNSLSVPQRKLLLLIQEGVDYRTLLAAGSSAERERRGRDLARLLDLGLAVLIDDGGNAIPRDIDGPLARSGAAPSPGNSTRTEPARSAPPPLAIAPGQDTAKRPPIAIIAAVGALLIGGLAWWVLRGGDEAPVPRSPNPAPTTAVSAPVAAAPATPSAVPVTLPVPGFAAPAPLFARVSAPISATTGRESASTGRPADTQLITKKEPAPAAVKIGNAAPPPHPPRSEPPTTQAAPAVESARPPVPVVQTEPAVADAASRAAPQAVNPAPQSAAASSAPPPVPAPLPASVAPTIASAAPTAAPVPAVAAPKILARVNPEFPTEAARDGVTAGTVKARMQVGADGGVTAVEILQSTPRRVFDRAVTRALSQWKFEPTGKTRAVDFEVEFKLPGA